MRWRWLSVNQSSRIISIFNDGVLRITQSEERSCWVVSWYGTKKSLIPFAVGVIRVITPSYIATNQYVVSSLSSWFDVIILSVDNCHQFCVTFYCFMWILLFFFLSERHLSYPVSMDSVQQYIIRRSRRWLIILIATHTGFYVHVRIVPANKEVIFPPNGGCLILEGVQFFIPKWFYSFCPYYCKYSSMASLVMEQKIWLSHVHPLGAQWACCFFVSDSVIMFSSQRAVRIAGRRPTEWPLHVPAQQGGRISDIFNKFVSSDKAWETHHCFDCNLT